MSNQYQLTLKPAPKWLTEFWPIFVGIVCMYFPTYYALANDAWSNPEQAQGPIVLLIILFLFWERRQYLINPPLTLSNKLATIFGWALIVTGVMLYIVGRAFDILILDVGSQIPIFSGILVIIRGFSMLRIFWFPLFFILFIIPLPGFLVDAITLPMKIAVSHVAENVLYWMNYPIARSGVLLQIGSYQLLVADACAGMHTLVSLEALGLLYLHMVKRDSLFRNVSLAILIIPISFTANVIRVIFLILVTYYYGDEVGQGFVHGFAGMFLFIVALLLIIFVDSTLHAIDKNKKSYNLKVQN